MIELRITESAALSIAEQADYYERAADPALAQQWEEAVDRTVKSLLSLPERGAPCRFRAPALAGLRWILIPGFPRHMVFYRYLAREQAVLIVHVVHGARHLETLLDDDV